MMNSLYHHSLALMTDFYEITMAYAYWKSQMENHEAVFHLFFRRQPFKGGFTVFAGLENVIDYLERWKFSLSDLDFLATLKDECGEPIFEEKFLSYLHDLSFQCDLDSVVEGDIVFPYEPLIRIKGPIIQAQLLETPLLTLINFSSLIATKAARMCLAAGGDPVLEFGLRRAQGIDGAMTATRSSFIGGCSATSNTLAAKLYQIPVIGTHAHSWVMAFESELEAFKAYAHALPNQSVFLVDTYDTLQGVRHAIEVAKWLKEQGRVFLGIRLDSGDMHYLSIESRKLLNQAGFPEAKIVASNELNEWLIADLKQQGAKIAVWGVGTHLVTGFDHPALDGVYKLSAYRKNQEASWNYKLKISEKMAKISDPGILQVRRYYNALQGYVADAIYDQSFDFNQKMRIIDPFDPMRSRFLPKELGSRDLLVPIFREGKCYYQKPTLQAIQAFCRQELSYFDQGIKRFYNPHGYPVGLEESLYQLKLSLVNEVKTSYGKSA